MHNNNTNVKGHTVGVCEVRGGGVTKSETATAKQTKLK